ncbi:MAG: pirin-like C-terminal cupin domain-containing protein, partial [Bacteroidota bacterium]
EQTVGENFLVNYSMDGAEIDITALDDDTTLLLLNGEPIDEPVYSYGPFVMNSEAEIHQAIQDYRSGKMGRL